MSATGVRDVGQELAHLEALVQRDLASRGRGHRHTRYNPQARIDRERECARRINLVRKRLEQIKRLRTALNLAPWESAHQHLATLLRRTANDTDLPAMQDRAQAVAAEAGRAVSTWRWKRLDTTLADLKASADRFPDVAPWADLIRRVSACISDKRRRCYQRRWGGSG